MFRRFALDHPALFSIGIQRTLPSSELWPQFRAAANDALAVLSQRLARLQDSKLLARRTVREATIQFHALCEGLAALELRATFPPEDADRIWRDALTALITGFATTPPRQPSGRTTTTRRPTKQPAATTASRSPRRKE